MTAPPVPDAVPVAPAAAHGAASEEPVHDDGALLEQVRTGDVAAFTALVQRYHRSLARVALGFVPSPAIADEVVQETWLAVCKGLHRFQDRSSFRTWLFSILINRARTRGKRERRTLPFSALATSASEDGIDRFSADGAWVTPPRSWGAESPEDVLLRDEMTEVLDRAIAALPDRYRIIVTLRDIEELPSDDVCRLLDISNQNQRVLLHRARSQLRLMVEAHLLEGEPR